MPDADLVISTPDNSIDIPPEHGGMVRIPGGTFRMGSDRHYPEEAPVHRVSVGAFWIDPTPGPEGRLASVRAQLLPPLPSGGASPAAGRHFDELRRFPLHQKREEDPMTSDRVSSQTPG